MKPDSEKMNSLLADIEEIKTLKYTYADICDHGHDTDRMLKIFAEDGSWSGALPDGIWDGAEAGYGTAKGHKELRELFKAVGKGIYKSRHNMLNPIIEVNGDRAYGKWNMIIVTETDESKSMHFGFYEEEYIKINGKWLYQSMRNEALFSTEI